MTQIGICYRKYAPRKLYPGLGTFVLKFSYFAQFWTKNLINFKASGVLLGWLLGWPLGSLLGVILVGMWPYLETIDSLSKHRQMAKMAWASAWAKMAMPFTRLPCWIKTKYICMFCSLHVFSRFWLAMFFPFFGLQGFSPVWASMAFHRFWLAGHFPGFGWQGFLSQFRLAGFLLEETMLYLWGFMSRDTNCTTWCQHVLKYADKHLQICLPRICDWWGLGQGGNTIIISSSITYYNFRLYTLPDSFRNIPKCTQTTTTSQQSMTTRKC